MKKLLIALVALVCLLAVIGMFLPADYHVARATKVKAEPAQIFNQINRLENWKSWMVWIRRDPGMSISFSGPAEGVGATMTWESKSQGSGSLVIKESHPDTGIVYTLTFPDMPSSTGRMTIVAGSDAHEVTWSDAGTMGNNPFTRYFGLLLDGMIGPDFEQGLANLKEVCENLPPAAAPEEAPPVDDPDAMPEEADGTPTDASEEP